MSAHREKLNDNICTCTSGIAERSGYFWHGNRLSTIDIVHLNRDLFLEDIKNIDIDNPAEKLGLGLLSEMDAWKVLIVDDEEEVHNITKMALRDSTFEEKPIKFISAYSGREACEIMRKNPDVALILLDVVMEHPKAGLDVIRYLRESLNNNFVRITLRTGMVDPTEEKKLIIEYDINDFRAKTDLTPRKLFSLVFSSLRAYSGIRHLSESENLAKEQQKQLLLADKMVALGTLVSGVAHEINNPNNLIIFNVPILKRIWESIHPILEEYKKEKGDFPMGGLNYTTMQDKIPILLNGIEQGASRIKNIVSSLRDFSRDGTTGGMKQAVDLNEVIDTAVKMMGTQIKIYTTRFDVKKADQIPAFEGNFQKMEQVVVNLVINACQSLSSREKGVVISTRYDKKSKSVKCIVEDEGVGIEEKNLRRISDPFFTTKQDQKGTGLGLSISESIIKEHGGELTFKSQLGKGTTAVFEIPVPPKKIEK